MFDFTDKVVMVTGAAGNLGRKTAFAFYRSGAKLAVVDARRDQVREIFSGMIPEGESCYFVTADLMDEVSVAQSVAGIVNQFGRIDVLSQYCWWFHHGAVTS